MSTGTQQIYSNMINVGMSQFDITLDVKYRHSQQVEDKCQIIMSPQHFKALVEAMAQTLLQYEDLFGPLQNQLKQDVYEKMQQAGQLEIEEFNHVGRG